MRPPVALLLASFAALVAPAVAPAQEHAHQQAQELRAVVGPNFDILLTDANGARVRHLDPGTYTIHVEDRSDFHNFHLSGPGVNRATDVEAVGTETWQVTFTDGVYDYVCDPHADAMRGTFTVGTATLPPPATRLTASVGPRLTISLRNAAGARVTMLPAGAYVITVRDRSRAHNFVLSGPGLRRATRARFTGTVTWRVTLRAGTYRFFSASNARRLRGSFHVH